MSVERCREIFQGGASASCNSKRMASFAIVFLSACRVGGGLSAGLEEVPNPVPKVSIPTVVSPATSPYYSNESNFKVSGMCQKGLRIVLTGPSNDQVTCSDDSSYEFSLSQSEDGVYSYSIAQVDTSETLSAPASFVWVRKSSVSAPVITQPPLSVWPSAQSALVISGSCESGAVLKLGGDGAGSTTCSKSAFALTLPKAADGDFNISVSQTDMAGNTATSLLTWKKHALVVTPSGPSLQVQTSQVFTIAGGSGSYTASLESNNSGATFNSGALNYTAGTLSGTADVLKVLDSVGAITRVTIGTVSGPPDHLDMGSGDAQYQDPGTRLINDLKVRIVDAFGNGIPSVNLLFSLVDGDLTLGGNLVQTSNAMGFAQIPAALQYSAVRSHVRVAPLVSSLPDNAATGRATLKLTASATSRGAGSMGLNFSIGNGPKALVYGDFNGDGITDIAVLNSADNKVGILDGVGNGLFAKMRNFGLGACSAGSSMAKADINGDGKTDLVIACSGNDIVVRLLGTGDGNFTLASGSVATCSQPASIAVGDFNKDSKGDFAVACMGSNQIGVYKGNGDGTFQAGVTYAAGLSPSAIAVGDFDHNLTDDVIVANSGAGTVTLFSNNGSGILTSLQTVAVGAGPSAILAGDFNSDGYLDVAVANSTDASVSVLLNNQSGLLASALESPVGTSPNALYASDLDSNGKLDLVVSNSLDGTLSKLMGLGNGLFATPVTIPVFTSPSAVVVFDSNRDSSPDIFVASAGALMLQEMVSNGNSGFGLNYKVGTNPQAVDTGDIDGDGKVDQVVANYASNSISIFKGRGNGLMTLVGAVATGAGPRAVKLVDLNRDGKLDLLVVCENANTLTVYFGDGLGGFSGRVDYPVASHPYALAVGDLLNNGKLGVVVTNSGSNTVSVLLGDGGGTLKPKIDYGTGGFPRGVVLADLNGDGNLDISTSNFNEDSVSVLLGNGDGTFRMKSDFAAGSAPYDLIAGDFNSDNIVDLAVLNQGDGSVSILRGIGNGSFQAANNFFAGGTVTAFASGDFTGDGKLDLAVSNGNLNTISILAGLGNGNFNSPVSFATSSDAGALKATDCNGDGKLDLSVLMPNANEVQVWLGQ